MRVERRQPERDDAERDRTTQVATMASSARQVLRRPGCVQTLSNTRAAQGACKRYPTRKPPITFFVARGCGVAAGRTVAAPRELPVPSAQAMAGTGGAPPQAPPRGRRLLLRRWPSSWLLVLVLVVLLRPVAGRSTATLQPQDRIGHTGAVLKGHIFPLFRSQVTSSASHLSRRTPQRVNGYKAEEYPPGALSRVRGFIDLSHMNDCRLDTHEKNMGTVPIVSPSKSCVYDSSSRLPLSHH